ncbi:VOC family protein [Kitasatospora purpeofusca]|uniref:VOC family protein n=1 Tax=Kitasatospora purpeofusca TaxID=67352 RepID=UPI000A80E533|nr:VOC family protein [Kitasatospora purpeofusca]MCX4754979.1 VOC family protein [Kitasatospora purpeofusca]WSR34358.1 VOC family protein [Kitasatospora purpeofusca]WSR42582.1 VOC family protein [Kitasatospora purpeofusca]
MTTAAAGTDSVVPDRYRYAVVPRIMVDDAAAAIDFYQRAFGAREDFRIDAPGGVLHAEISIGAASRGAGRSPPSCGSAAAPLTPAPPPVGGGAGVSGAGVSTR